MPTVEVGSRKNIQIREQGTYVVRVCMYAYKKGARVRPTSRVYGDADPGLVSPTAAAAAASAAAAAMLREAHTAAWCRSRHLSGTLTDMMDQV